MHLKVLSLDRFCVYSTQHHWPTFYDSMKCTFTFAPMTLNCIFLSLQTTTWNITNSITKIEECLSDNDKWMSINRLKLNKGKTELLYLFSKYNSQQSLPPLRFQTEIIKPSPHARNISAIFDTTMSMLPHVNNVNLPFIIFVPKNVSKSFNRCRMQLPE